LPERATHIVRPRGHIAALLGETTRVLLAAAIIIPTLSLRLTAVNKDR
jgi:hypothetical protein